MGKRFLLILERFFLDSRRVGPGFAAETEKLPPLSPLRTDTPPVIDGVLDDPVWAKPLRRRDSRPGGRISARTCTKRRSSIMPMTGKTSTSPTAAKTASRPRSRLRSRPGTPSTRTTGSASISTRSMTSNPCTPSMSILSASRAIPGSRAGQEDFTSTSSGTRRAGSTHEATRSKSGSRSRASATGSPIRSRWASFSRGTSAGFPRSGTYPPLDPAQGLNFLTQTRTLHFTGYQTLHAPRTPPGRDLRPDEPRSIRAARAAGSPKAS